MEKSSQFTEKLPNFFLKTFMVHGNSIVTLSNLTTKLFEDIYLVVKVLVTYVYMKYVLCFVHN